MLYSYLFTTNIQKVLSLLLKFSDLELYDREIGRKLGISAGSTNRALNELLANGVVKRQKKGKMYFYSIDFFNTTVTEFKKIVNLMLVEPLIEELKKLANRIVLYGSCAQGADTSQSDIDLFVVSTHKRAVSNTINNYRFPKGYEIIHIQPVIKTSIELLEGRESDRFFINEVEQGITLWEKVASERRV